MILGLTPLYFFFTHLLWLGAQISAALLLIHKWRLVDGSLCLRLEYFVLMLYCLLELLVLNPSFYKRLQMVRIQSTLWWHIVDRFHEKILLMSALTKWMVIVSSFHRVEGQMHIKHTIGQWSITFGYLSLIKTGPKTNKISIWIVASSTFFCQLKNTSGNSP